MWILYSHMFTDYLLLYQFCIGIIIPVITCIPLGILRINYETKFIVMLFVIKFVSIQSTFMDFIGFWAIVLVIHVRNDNKEKIKFSGENQKLNKTLGLIASVGSTLFLLILKRILNLYLTSWMVNIGYVFLFTVLVWMLITVWIVELVNIELEQYLAGSIK